MGGEKIVFKYVKLTIGDDAKQVKGIAFVDVHLLHGRICGGMGRDGTIGRFKRVIGVIRAIGFLVSLELFWHI